MICTQQIFGSSHQEERDGQGMLNIWGRSEVHSVSWWGDPGIVGGMILKWIFIKLGGGQ